LRNVINLKNKKMNSFTEQLEYQKAIIDEWEDLDIESELSTVPTP
jgi:hypothetical protein